MASLFVPCGSSEALPSLLCFLVYQNLQLELDKCQLRVDLSAVSRAMSSPSAQRKRVAANEGVSVDDDPEGLSPSKRGRFSAKDDSPYLHVVIVDDTAKVCAPIRFAADAVVAVTTVSEDAVQAMLDMTCAKIISECETLEMNTVQVDSLVPCSTGGWALLGSTMHSRFEQEDAAEHKRARVAFNARIRGHPMFRNIFKHLFNTPPKVSKKDMELLDVITLEATLKERVEADQHRKAPMFGVKSTAKKIDPRQTYHEGFMLAGAADFKGPVMHMRASIDKGVLSATYTRTIMNGKDLKSNSFLRVFIKCPHQVVMND